MIPTTITTDDIRKRIYTVRGMRVMLDSDLAQLYQVETRVLNQAVKRNNHRFPEGFCFQLTRQEFDNLISQSVISRSATNWGGIRKLPIVFTEHGVTMLSSVLKSEIAISIGVRIVQEFISMRHYYADNAVIIQRLDRIELRQLEADEKFNQIFKQLESTKPDKAVIFYKGQMWDALSCIEEIISKAQKTIILIDGYVDKGTLDMLSRKKSDVSVDILTFKKTCNLNEKEIDAFQSQYGKLDIKYTDEFHDRFLILDHKVLYHIGASIKDAGKKAFEISLTEDKKVLESIIERLTMLVA